MFGTLLTNHINNLDRIKGIICKDFSTDKHLIRHGTSKLWLQSWNKITDIEIIAIVIDGPVKNIPPLYFKMSQCPNEL